MLESGFYEPFQVDACEVADLMREKNIISEEDIDYLHYTKEDENRLKEVLENEWDTLPETYKVIWHVLNQTSLPRWGKLYPSHDFLPFVSFCITKHSCYINNNNSSFISVLHYYDYMLEII